MGIDNIWVFAETNAAGGASSATLELLTKANSLGGSVTAFVAGSAGDAAAAFADHGAAKIYETGDLAGALPGAAVSAAMKAVIDGGDSPDLVMFPQNYEGRDVMSRLSVKLDRTVLTNSTDISVDGDSVSAQTPIFGGAKIVTATFTGEAPYLAAFRPKSFEPAGGAGAAGEVVA
ncbi:MAG: electron transfer flavoprotein subunit alpha/FixB family protein, partial [Ilumatobacter sp.]